MARTRHSKFSAVSSLTILVLVAACASHSSRGGVADAAVALLTALDDEQRSAACLAFDDAERTNWQFVPGAYPGIQFGDLSTSQRVAADRLLASVLSRSGLEKTRAIIGLEHVLREAALVAGRTGEVAMRDPDRFSIAIFGDPTSREPWGFRLQGHHISWNFSSIDDRVVAVPAFLGSNPAEVREGPHKGLRVLAAEEDRARALLATLSAAQRTDVMLSDRAPADVLWGPGRLKAVIGEPMGLAYAAMRVPQRELLWKLIEVYAKNLTADVAEAHLAKIEAAGRDAIRFAWMGSTERGKGHYYRIHGPTFVIEYDNVQNAANHAHCVWHDLSDDFGHDALRQHYLDEAHDADGHGHESAGSQF